MGTTKIGETERFDYTGAVQKFYVPFNGLYKLEVYGAAGGAPRGSRAKGGYSIGYKILKKGTILYVVCGGMGSYDYWSTVANGGYNGGGSITHTQCRGATGGGCTHIALMSGTLQEIGSANVSKVLIVAGGAGGSGRGGDNADDFSGGIGGGIAGANGAYKSSDSYVGYGAGQGLPPTTTGYYRHGNFGLGGQAGGENSYYGGAGGGGYYGGNGGDNCAGGGGGSGYIGGVPEVTYKGIKYSPRTQAGGNTTYDHGWAVVTLIKKDISTMYLGDFPVKALFLGDIEAETLRLGDKEVD